MDDSRANVSVKNVVETEPDFEHAFTERFRSCLERLQHAVTVAHLHEVCDSLQFAKQFCISEECLHRRQQLRFWRTAAFHWTRSLIFL